MSLEKLIPRNIAIAGSVALSIFMGLLQFGCGSDPIPTEVNPEPNPTSVPTVTPTPCTFPSPPSNYREDTTDPADNTQVRVLYNAQPDADHFKHYKDGTYFDQSPANSTAYVYLGLPNAIPVTVQSTTVDGCGVESTLSAPKVIIP